MLRLRPYKACDAQTITKWLKSEYAFRQWSADRYEKYPITAEDMNGYYDRDKDNEKIWGMTVFDDTGIIGHFTMRFPDAHNLEEIRLGFVIVDDTKRGKGYGKEMVSLAVQYAFDFIKVKKISLGVFENNTVALECYKACGFRTVELQEVENYHCMGEVWKCIEMELVK
ncbi:MAG: GNAT family N-acetyltransferase [Lachnospiraceae bacterium]|nr:GNAT family N-acetyltransferase [Lachnospiraceae bacterium]MDE6626438.1 GNAT family N-acetyltransferase [Lachnospiraceae bacterium]